MYHFIINPSSSSGKGRKIWPLLEQRLQETKTRYLVYFTKEKGHATRLARWISANKSPCTIVAVGGDGCANEVINGLCNYDSIVFGYIPTGSGNDLARGLHLSAHPLNALNCILHPKLIAKVNVGINQSSSFTKKFIVSTGIGYDAAVCHDANRSKMKPFLNKIGLGKLTYTAIALKQLISIQPSSMMLIMDDKRKHFYRKAYFITAMNLKYEGGGFMFCPKALPSDNLLDICIIEKISKLKLIFMLPTAFFGKHCKIKGVHIFQCKKARIQSDDSLYIHTDGEILGTQSEISLSLETKQLSFILS